MHQETGPREKKYLDNEIDPVDDTNSILSIGPFK